jgi:hypothetical protein
MTYAQRKRTAERKRKAAPPRGGKTELEKRDERPRGMNWTTHC